MSRGQGPDPVTAMTAAPERTGENRDGPRLCELVLAGFGVYDHPTRFLFPDGPAVFHGPNESGKSTVLAGIQAVLFGLPASTNPAEYGTARYRSLASSSRAFYGTLRWRRGDQEYRLHRAFESRRVRLTCSSAAGEEELYSGEHNPLGRSSAGSAFPRLLRSILGISQRHLFVEATCLLQPGDGDRRGAGQTGHGLSSELCHIISGSRTGRIDDIKTALFEAARRLTSATGDQGLIKPGGTRAVNQHQQGAIEQIEQRIIEARETLESSRELLDEYNRLSVERQAEEARHGLHRAERDATTKRAETLGGWLALDEQRRQRAATASRLRRALEELDEIARLRETLAGELRTYAAFEDVPADLPRRIEALGEALSRRATHEALAANAQRQNAARAAREAELDEEISCLRQSLEALPDLFSRPSPGERSIAALEAETRSFLHDVERLDEIEARWSLLDAQLADQDFLRGARLDALRSMIDAGDEIRDLRLRARELELRRREAAHTVELSSAPHPEAGSADRASAISGSTRTARSSAVPNGPGGSSRRLGWLLALAAVLVASGALLAFTGFRNAGVALLSCGALLALATAGRYAGLSLRRFLRTRRANSASRAEAGAGTGAEPPAETLTDPTAQGQDVDAAATFAGKELDGIKARLHALELSIQYLSSDLGPFATTTRAELARMEQRWEQAEAERGLLDREGGRIRGRWFPQEPQAPAGPPDVTGAPLPLQQVESTRNPRPRELMGWRDVARPHWSETLCRLADFAFALEPEWPQDRLLTAGSLHDTLLTLDAEKWRLLRQTQARGQELESRLAAATAERERPLPDIAAPCSPETGGGEADWRRALECAAKEIVTAWPHVEDPGVSFEPASVPLAPPGSRSSLALRLGQAPVDEGRRWVQRLREDERSAASAWLRHREIRDREAAVLATARAASVDALRDQIRTEEAALGQLAIRQESILAGNTALAALREMEDPAERAAAALEAQRGCHERVRQLDERIETSRQRIQALALRNASLEGRRPAFVAQEELELTELERELIRLREERDAILLAWSWLQQAAETYQSTYREDLEQRITAHFRTLSGAPRRVVLDQDFRAGVLGSRGERLVAEQLSQGTRDQLALAIRLGVADLLADALPLPLFFDDSFVHYDSRRLEQLRPTLDRLGKTRQWVLFTHREDLRDWAPPVVVIADREQTGPPAAENTG